MKRMVETDDRSGLGKPVSLHDQKAEPAPEFLQLLLQRRAAHHEAEEAVPEQTMRPAITPSPDKPMRIIGLDAAQFGELPDDVSAQRVEHPRHRHEKCGAPPANLPD